MSKFSINVNTTVAEVDYRRLESNMPNLAETLPSLIAYLLTQYAQGGVMLKADDVSGLVELSQGEIKGGADIIRLAQAGMGRDKGGFTVECSIDPALMEPIKDMAHMQNRNVQSFIEDALNTMMVNGWLYQFSPTGGTAHFSLDQWEVLWKAFGHMPTGDEIFKALTTGKLPAEKAEGKKTKAVQEKPDPAGVVANANA